MWMAPYGGTTHSWLLGAGLCAVAGVALGTGSPNDSELHPLSEEAAVGPARVSSGPGHGLEAQSPRGPAFSWQTRRGRDSAESGFPDLLFRVLART